MIKQPEKPKTRAEKRRMKRELIKQINPPKYGPVTIYRETFEKVEGGKNVTFKRGYQGRTNVKSQMVKEVTCFKKDENKPESCPENCRVHGTRVLTDEQMAPGAEVERHLQMYGHLPEEGCCEHDQIKQPTKIKRK